MEKFCASRATHSASPSTDSVSTRSAWRLIFAAVAVVNNTIDVMGLDVKGEGGPAHAYEAQRRWLQDMHKASSLQDAFGGLSGQV